MDGGDVFFQNGPATLVVACLRVAGNFATVGYGGGSMIAIEDRGPGDVDLYGDVSARPANPVRRPRLRRSGRIHKQATSPSAAAEPTNSCKALWGGTSEQERRSLRRAA